MTKGHFPRDAKLVILTGAGISAESGLGTFRDKGGVWTQYDLAEVATPEGFARNPTLVHDFYNARRANAAAAAPNAAHHALAQLQAAWPGEVVLITQNVDDLHERAGSTAVIHIHGILAGAVCAACDHRWQAPARMAPLDTCPSCDAAATRPDIVWFGEMPYRMEEIAGHLDSAEVFVAIGTSGQVYPAAGFVEEAAQMGAHTVEINLSQEPTSPFFQDRRFGPASRAVPDWVDEMLARS
ncbi:MAG: NAD-dependent deacylase [Celeribacter sp.]|jgi:NAD-dependent deacetylase